MKTWAISIMMLLGVVTNAQGSDPNLLLYDPLDSIETIEANGGLASGVTFAEGMMDDGAVIEGFIDYPYEGRFNRDAGTIQFLLKPDDPDSMGLLEVGRLGFANSVGIFRFGDWGRQITVMEVRKSDDSYLQAWHDKAEARLENGQWYLVTAIWRGNQAPNDFFQLYVNNVPGYRHTGSVCTPLFEPDIKHIRLGDTYGYSHGCGCYDELAIYDYPKSHQEIDRDYRRYFGLPPAEPDAIGWLSGNQDCFTTGLVESQVGFADQRAFTYDQALAVVAFTHAGQPYRARRILDQMQTLQNAEGAWRNAYSPVDGSVWESDFTTGPVAWMLIATNYYEWETGDDSYADMAEAAVSWLEKRIDKDPGKGSYGALNLGTGMPGNPEQVFSTEHQLDAYSAFRGRATFFAPGLTRTRLFAQAEDVLLYLMREVWNGDHFQRGYGDSERWLDCQTLAPLALGATGPGGQDLLAALDCAYDTMRRTLDYDSQVRDVSGFSYNDYENTIWVEGTLQAALAYSTFNDPQRGDYFSGEVARTVRDDRGLSYSFDESGTGDDSWPRNLRYSCVSSVVWYYFHQERLNPLAVARVPTYRFWSPVKKRHFYTINEPEMRKLIDRYSHVWTYEEVAYLTLWDDSDLDCLPVYRFWSDVLSAHFYTISETERDKLLTSHSDVWAYEGVAFYAYPPGVQPPDTSAVYRFWSDQFGCHFYTISKRERDKLIDYYSHVWTYEGIAWYAYE